jgi:hypothetical protein
MFPKYTRPTGKCRETIKEFLKDVFKKEPYSRDIGNKELDVISSSENEPQGVYIRLYKLGSREPWCMGNGEISWEEYEISFLLDVRVSETEQQTPDKSGPRVNIKNVLPGVPSSRLGDNGEIAENVCDSLLEIFSYREEWRTKLSSIGIHNVRIVDERETYQGTEYQNPMRIVFNAYVQT